MRYICCRCEKPFDYEDVRQCCDGPICCYCHDEEEDLREADDDLYNRVFFDDRLRPDSFEGEGAVTVREVRGE